MTERVAPYSYGGPGCGGLDPACAGGCDTECSKPTTVFAGDYYEYGEKVLAEARKAKMSPRDRLFLTHDELCARAKALMELKNRDYATDDDPYRNFRTFGALGILVRMSDKLARLRNYVENGSYRVKEESLLDTALDMVNYTAILLGYINEEMLAGRRGQSHAEDMDQTGR